MRVLLIVLLDDVKTKASSFKCYQEIEDRAPTIQRQRDDHEKAVETVANLTTQLDLSVQQCDSEKLKYFEAHRLLAQTQRSSQRFEKQAVDLSKQVTFLIHEVEELRGNRMRDAPPDFSPYREGSASEVISRHLVTFRDVMQLQQRNQMLLTTLREVTEGQDEKEQTAVEAKTAKLQQALENALREMEHHRDTRRY